MNKRIAVTVMHRHDNYPIVPNQLDDCNELIVYEVTQDGNLCMKETYLTLKEFPEVLIKLDVNMIISGEMDDNIMRLLREYDIKVTYEPGSSLRQVIEQYVKRESKGNLKAAEEEIAI